MRALSYVASGARGTWREGVESPRECFRVPSLRSVLGTLFRSDIGDSQPYMPNPRKPFERTDREILGACREGDARAWREIVRRYSRLVLGVPRSMGLQADDADEVFQLTFSALFRTLSRLREPDRVEAWLVTASRRASLRILRDQRRRTRLALSSHADDPDRTAPAADERIERLRERERVARALRSLSEPCRSFLTAMFSDQGGSYRELAARLGLAVGTLGSQRARCLERLRQRLLRRHDRLLTDRESEAE